MGTVFRPGSPSVTQIGGAVRGAGDGVQVVSEHRVPGTVSRIGALFERNLHGVVDRRAQRGCVFPAVSCRFFRTRCDRCLRVVSFCIPTHPHDCKLRPVLKATLAKSGALGNMKAQMRAEIFRALECDSVGAAHAFCATSDLCRPAVMVRRLHRPQEEPKPSPPREVFLINELIREYLEFQGYKHSLSVFLPGRQIGFGRCHENDASFSLMLIVGAASTQRQANP
eukprot:COSAG01_NODE_1133_length_11566_cov_25.815819_7_plen_225_part_00